MRNNMDYLKIKQKILENVTITPSGCWEYHKEPTTGLLQSRMIRPYRGGSKYPTITVEGKNWPVYRLSWAVYNGGIEKLEKGKLICHKCNNPPCCNPDHLYQGTHSDNMADRRGIKNRKNRYGFK